MNVHPQCLRQELRLNTLSSRCKSKFGGRFGGGTFQADYWLYASPPALHSSACFPQPHVEGRSLSVKMSILETYQSSHFRTGVRGKTADSSHFLWLSQEGFRRMWYWGEIHGFASNWLCFSGRAWSGGGRNRQSRMYLLWLSVCNTIRSTATLTATRKWEYTVNRSSVL